MVAITIFVFMKYRNKKTLNKISRNKLDKLYFQDTGQNSDAGPCPKYPRIHSNPGKRFEEYFKGFEEYFGEKIPTEYPR